AGGLTSGAKGRPGLPSYRSLRAIYEEHGTELPRVTLAIGYPGAERLRAFPHRTGDGDDRLRIGPIGEMAVDGGFTGPTAYTLADYKSQPGFRGKLFMNEAELQEVVDTCAQLGWQVGLHAIGDAAIVTTVEAYDRALKKYPRTGPHGADPRWYLAHFTIM